jgi:KDO2-lipid IV(A) lauroyltransferase
MLAPAIVDIASRIAAALPSEAREALARGAASLQYAFDRDRREATLANLAVIAASGARADLAAPGALRRTARRQFESHAASFLEHLAHARPDSRALRDGVRWGGTERLYAAVAGGRGAVICVSHVGNWEMAGLALARLGLVVHVVTGVQWHRAFTGVARALKERARIRVSTPADGFTPLLATLRSGGLAVLLVDGDVYSRALPVRFFGRSVPFPAGPAILARRTGAALLHAHAERLGRDRWRFCFDGLDLPDPARGLADDLGRLTQRAAEVQERNIAAHLGQWGIFRPMFTAAPRGAGAVVPPAPAKGSRAA